VKEYIFNYYPRFKCIAQKCKHTCCAGWEMNIDSETLEIYKNDKSSFSSALKCGINYKKSKFKADKNKRCAFLNEQGLCEIILNLGEKSLCQVCRDHPRFRSFFSDRIETGLGFCCEEATRQILSFEDKIEPVLVSDNGASDTLDYNENNVLQFREKALNILQNRELDINQRIDDLLKLCKAKVSETDFAKIVKAFLRTERLDKGWTKRVKKLKKINFDKITPPNLSLFAEQFLVNGLYRNLSYAEDTMWVRARAITCIFAWWIVKSIIAQEQGDNDNLLELCVDVVRAYSTEIEYSENNLEKLFSFAYKLIKIG